MKLKTKFQDEDFDLGEVIEANIYHGGDGGVKVVAEPTGGGIVTFYLDTLKEINEMFEDYEEPKEYWYIAELCGGLQRKQDTDNGEDRFNKQIGNYFLSKEEAEKAVERLRAWTRLKDKGFRFCCDIRYESLCGNGFNIPLNATMPPEAYTDVGVSKDLDTCFGGEE